MTSRRIRVADTDADPIECPVAFGVAVSRETATEDDPARVQVTLTNHGDDAIELYTGHPGVFGTPASEEYDPGLFLTPAGTTPGKMVPADRQEPTGYAIPGYLQRIDLAPGASESQTLDVSSEDPTDSPGALPGGTFTFRAAYDRGPSPDVEATFEWGFSLAVESPA